MQPQNKSMFVPKYRVVVQKDEKLVQSVSLDITREAVEENEEKSISEKKCRKLVS